VTFGPAIPGGLRIDGAGFVQTVAASPQFASSSAITFDSTGGTPTLLVNHGDIETVASLNSFQSGAGAVLIRFGELIVSSGTFTGTIAGVGTFEKQGPDAMSVAEIGVGRLNVAGGTVSLSDGGRISALSIAPDARMILGGTLTIFPGFDDASDPVVTLRSYLSGGRLIPTAGSTLGYADGADGVVPGLDPGSVLVRATLPGDVNLDGKVDFTDLLLLAQHYGQTGARWDQGDLNYDAGVEFADLLDLAQNYAKVSEGPYRTAKVRRL
jgi:hypothetical protein